MMSQHSSPGQGASPGSGSGPAASHYGPSSVSLVSPQHHGASPAQSTFTTSSSNMVPAGHHSGAGTGGPHSAQQNYQPQPYPAQGYNPGAHTGPQPFPGYPGQPGAQQWNKNNGARSGPPGHSNNWETSSQHSNSSQKKFSSSSGRTERR